MIEPPPVAKYTITEPDAYADVDSAKKVCSRKTKKATKKDLKADYPGKAIDLRVQDCEGACDYGSNPKPIFNWYLCKKGSIAYLRHVSGPQTWLLTAEDDTRQLLLVGITPG